MLSLRSTCVCNTCVCNVKHLFAMFWHVFDGHASQKYLQTLFLVLFVSQAMMPVWTIQQLQTKLAASEAVNKQVWSH